MARLERERAEGRRAVRGIRTTGALQARLRAAYPALGDGGWGLTTLPLDDGDTLGLEYLLVPAWFAETFLVDRANARSWRAQRDRLVAVDSLRGAVATLQDSLAALAEARAEAWSIGYDSAYTRHQELTRRYVAALDRPRIRLPGILGLAAAAGVGLMVGRVAR